MERFNARLNDEFGGRWMRVRGVTSQPALASPALLRRERDRNDQQGLHGYQNSIGSTRLECGLQPSPAERRAHCPKKTKGRK